jgi:hypothetical protein
MFDRGPTTQLEAGAAGIHSIGDVFSASDYADPVRLS